MAELMREAVAACAEPHGRPASPARCPRCIVDVVIAAVVVAEPPLPTVVPYEKGEFCPLKDVSPRPSPRFAIARRNVNWCFKTLQ